MNEPAQGLPPWIRPELQSLIEWRDGDIVISVPVKSGTTWTMNIVHQLLTGGDAAFEDIYAEVPWIEFVQRPGQPPREMLDRISALPADRPRAFKSHSAPPRLPYLDAQSGTRVRYVVVCRNPEEALVSLRPFLAQHSDRWFDLWGVPKAAFLRPDFRSFYNEVVDANGMQGMLFGFLAAWWPLRHRDNVLLLHFADLKRDHEGAVRRIARFLEVDPAPGQWPEILRHTGFAWMKEHEDKFEGRSIGAVPVLESGAMIRRGRVGEAGAEGMTEAIANHLRQVGRHFCPDEAALEWFYHGGPLP